MNIQQLQYCVEMDGPTFILVRLTCPDLLGFCYRIHQKDGIYAIFKVRYGIVNATKFTKVVTT